MSDVPDTTAIDFFNSGCEEAEPLVVEPFTYSGSMYYGNFKEEEFQEQLTNGGFRNIRGSTLVIRKGMLPRHPVNGAEIVKDNITYRILGVTSDLVTYNITLADTSK